MPDTAEVVDGCFCYYLLEVTELAKEGRDKCTLSGSRDHAFPTLYTTHPSM